MEVSEFGVNVCLLRLAPNEKGKKQEQCDECFSCVRVTRAFYNDFDFLLSQVSQRRAESEE